MTLRSGVSTASVMARTSHSGNGSDESVGVHVYTCSLGRWMMDWSMLGVDMAPGPSWASGTACTVRTVCATSNCRAMSGCSSALAAPSSLMDMAL